MEDLQVDEEVFVRSIFMEMVGLVRFVDVYVVVGESVFLFL